MTELKVNQSDSIFALRHGALRSVDDMVEAVYEKVKDMGVLDNTYWIFTSDHG